MLTSLNRFISKSAQHALPFYRQLKEKTDFKWTTHYEEEFKSLKITLATPLVLTRPYPRKVLYLYLYVAKAAASTVMVRDSDAHQRLMHFIYKSLARE